MNLKRITAGAMVALAGLAFTAVIAANPFATQANSQQADETTKLPVTEHLQATEDEDAKTEPYIGVAITTVTAAEAEELGIAGGARVIDVQDDGPASGTLEDGDIITAIDGQAVTSASDVVEIVRAADVGDVLAVTVRRGDSTLDLALLVGEREVKTRTFARRFSRAMPVNPGKQDLSHMLMGQAMQLVNRLARGEMVVADEDGAYQTYRVAIGTVTESDSVAGTLTMQPKDGTDPIEYDVTAETQVNMNRTGDIGALNTEDTTVVVDVDGVAKIIHQGDLLEQNKGHGPGIGRRGHAGFGGMHGRSGRGQGPGQSRPNINIFRSFGPQSGQGGFPFFGQSGLGPNFLQGLPSEIQDIFESMEANGFDRGALHELVCDQEVLDQLPDGIEIRCETSDPDATPTISGDAL